MSLRRLTATAAAMFAVGAVLRVVSPAPSAMWAVLAAPQRVVDTAGPEGLLLLVAGALGWLAWGWSTLGLVATAAAALPGGVGRIGRAVQRVVLPQAGRRAAALLIGVGLGFAGPAGTASATTTADAGTTAGDPPPALDWSGPAVPDWPAAAPSGEYVVAAGDCLWAIAARRLTTAEAPRGPDAEIAVAVQAWWSKNADVIGPDPDLLLPGQHLRPPEPP